MVIAVWSVKGGVGTTSVAAMLAMAQVERAGETLLLDLDGDLPTVLGVDDVSGELGVGEWCATGRADPQALSRIEVEARPGLRLVPRGSVGLPDDATPLIDVLDTSQRTVIVDCGVVAGDTRFQHQVVERSSTSLLVVRECFLVLRAAQQSTIEPDGVILIKEPSRHLGRADVESATGAPVIAQIAFDPSIARSIDAGLARARLPRTLLRSIGRVFSDVA